MASATEIGPLMTDNVISGKNVAATVRSEIKDEVARLKAEHGKVCGCSLPLSTFDGYGDIHCPIEKSSSSFVRFDL